MRKLPSILDLIKILKSNPDLTEEELYLQLKSLYKTGYNLGLKKSNLVKE